MHHENSTPHSVESTNGRRTFLKAGGAATALAILAAGRSTHAADENPHAPLESENEKIVNAFCADWATKDADKLGSYFTEDAVFRMHEDAPPAETAVTITARLRMFLATAKKAEFVVVRSAAMGPIVLNERHDLFTMGDREVDYHMVGVFFIQNGKIAEWWDYRMPKLEA